LLKRHQLHTIFGRSATSHYLGVRLSGQESALYEKVWLTGLPSPGRFWSAATPLAGNRARM